jgi:FkbM family methyltransferase
MEFFEENRERFEAVYNMLADEESKRIYENVISYKLAGDIKYLWDSENDKERVYHEILSCDHIESYLDLGAYNGDTVREVLEKSPSVKKIYALEPDRRNFKKLSAFCSEYSGNTELIPINAAAWNENTTLTFGDEGNRNSGVFAPVKTAKAVEITALSPDSVFNADKIDYIKYDVEGAEREAVIGSQKTICEHRPTLLVSAYHRSEDIFALPLLVKSIRPDYKLYYRRYPYVPAWDLNLIFK